MNKVLDSKYIIDGLPKEFSPAQILGLQPTTSDGNIPSTIIDETVDTPSDPFRRTKLTIAESVIDSLWRKGHFAIDSLSVWIRWKGDSGKIGVPAAIYESVVQAAEYIEGLGFGTSAADFIESDSGGLDVETVVPEGCPCGRAVPAEPLADTSSWIIFVPFDSEEYSCHEPADTDYFIDCYELVREMVEDGIILSAFTKTIGNVPGAVLQITDSDFDYVDAEFILQDVAFYPVGHPSKDGSIPEIRIDGTTGIQKILSSLIQSRSAEGED